MSRKFTTTDTAEEVVELIKTGKITNTSNIYGLLNRIINDRPNTTVTEEAQDIKDEFFN